MKVETSVPEDDKFEEYFSDQDFEDLEKSHRKKRQHSAEIRRRIEEKLEEKWLRDELCDLDSY